jgi:hypothetical protein
VVVAHRNREPNEATRDARRRCSNGEKSRALGRSTKRNTSRQQSPGADERTRHLLATNRRYRVGSTVADLSLSANAAMTAAMVRFRGKGARARIRQGRDGSRERITRSFIPWRGQSHRRHSRRRRRGLGGLSVARSPRGGG